MQRLLITLIALSATFVVMAGPSSKVAWTPETLKFARNGNAGKGKTLAEGCTSCHGAAGEGMAAQPLEDDESIPAVPALAGQLATYTYKQLRDYADGSRDHASMGAIAKGLSEQDAADLAVWFASLPAPKKQGQEPTDRAKTLVSQGDDKRILPACFVCHGRHGEGEKQDIPSLAGQQPDYFVSTMQAFKAGNRHNDLYSRMRSIAKQLSDEEIKELAAYYRQLQP